MTYELPIDISEIEVDVTEFTDQVVTDTSDYTVTGIGIFDVLMDTATKHLRAQFDGNRIREEDYANAYIEIYKATLQAALEAWMGKKLAEAQAISALADIPLKEQEIALKAKQVEAMESEIALREKELELKEKQLDLLEQQLETEDAKADLYRRQIEGFDEDYKQKILKIMMDSWAVGFSVAKDSFEASGIPAPMQKTAIDDLFNNFIVTDLDDNSTSTTP